MAKLIEISSLHYAWPKQNDFSLDVEHLSLQKGQKLFLQGPSGCGKSTLLGLIAGINTPLSGQINILDTDFSRLSNSERDQFRADHIGVIFQMFNLLPYLTTIENVVLACQFSQMRTKRALENSTTLQEEAKRLLDHLDMASKGLLNKPVAELSIGQQQRVAAARALMGSPELIIADEPTSALDADRCQNFIELLFQECQATNAGLLFVSHDQSLRSGFDVSYSLSRSINENANGKASVSLQTGEKN